MKLRCSKGLLLIALFLLFLLQGCTTTASIKPSGRAVAATPALWHVAGHDSNAFLFGSFHLLPPGVNWYRGDIEQAFKGSDELVVESIDSPEEAARAMQLLENKALLPGGRTLDQYVDSETFAHIMEGAEVLGLDKARVARSQPWFLNILFAYESMSQSGIETRYGVDYRFEKEAARRAIKVSGLETMTEALNSLASQPLAVQVRRLQESIAGNEKSSTLADLYTAWSSGDQHTIERMMREEMSPGEYRRVLVDRNLRWLPRVEKHLAETKQTMIVVGAAHLVGREGLVALLRNKGYQVTRVQ